MTDVIFKNKHTYDFYKDFYVALLGTEHSDMEYVLMHNELIDHKNNEMVNALNFFKLIDYIREVPTFALETEDEIKICSEFYNSLKERVQRGLLHPSEYPIYDSLTKEAESLIKSKQDLSNNL